MTKVVYEIGPGRKSPAGAVDGTSEFLEDEDTRFEWSRGSGMPFVFYDTETTGTDTDFDQILQFAAIKTDDELNCPSSNALGRSTAWLNGGSGSLMV